MHDDMPYDPTQGQGQGHGASEIPKIALFTARRSYASAVLRDVILSVYPSVRPSVCHTRPL